MEAKKIEKRYLGILAILFVIISFVSYLFLPSVSVKFSKWKAPKSESTTERTNLDFADTDDFDYVLSEYLFDGDTFSASVLELRTLANDLLKASENTARPEEPETESFEEKALGLYEVCDSLPTRLMIAMIVVFAGLFLIAVFSLLYMFGILKAWPVLIGAVAYIAGNILTFVFEIKFMDRFTQMLKETSGIGYDVNTSASIFFGIGMILSIIMMVVFLIHGFLMILCGGRVVAETSVNDMNQSYMQEWQKSEAEWQGSDSKSTSKSEWYGASPLTNEWGGMKSMDSSNLSYLIPSSAINGCIYGIKGPYRGQEIPISSGEYISIGRNKNYAQLIVPGEKISRKHCTVSFSATEDAYYVVDSSANGTYLKNGKRLIKDKRTKVNRGEVISLGDQNISFELK